MAAEYRNPVPTVDIIIEITDTPEKSIVLIERKNPPYGWAIPGGFVDYGETLEDAAVREAYEETTLHIRNLQQFHTYSDPARDDRLHTISTVFTATADGTPIAADDAKEARIFPLSDIPDTMAFDHLEILNDYINNRR